jgi:hypothetical protein
MTGPESLAAPCAFARTAAVRCEVATPAITGAKLPRNGLENITFTGPQLVATTFTGPQLVYGAVFKTTTLCAGRLRVLDLAGNAIDDGAQLLIEGSLQ